jgi:putative FmdB family regulatory protein
MPLHEYVCSRCGKHIEAVQKVNDPPLKVCQFCGGALKKIISAPAIQFKGNGWYVTDYAKKSSPQKEEKKKETGKDKEKGASTPAVEKPSSSSPKD